MNHSHPSSALRPDATSAPGHIGFCDSIILWLAPFPKSALRIEGFSTFIPRFTRRSLIAFLLLLVLFFVGGCSTTTRDVLEIGPFYLPANVRGAATWPDDVQRIAVLPLDGTAATLPDDFISSHDAIWLAALQQTQRAEFIPVSREQIAHIAQGRRSVDSTSVLPAVFFEKILSITGADAVIFCDLTGVTPYPPLAIGLRAKLIHLRRGNLIWACDERFDASIASVGNSARRFARKSGDGSHRNDPITVILQSPTRFATYAATEVAGTLPLRRTPEPSQSATP